MHAASCLCAFMCLYSCWFGYLRIRAGRIVYVHVEQVISVSVHYGCVIRVFVPVLVRELTRWCVRVVLVAYVGLYSVNQERSE